MKKFTAILCSLALVASSLTISPVKAESDAEKPGDIVANPWAELFTTQANEVTTVAPATTVAPTTVQPQTTVKVDGKEILPALNQWSTYPNEGDKANATATNMTASIAAHSVGEENWAQQLVVNDLTLTAGKTYKATVKLTSSVDRKLQVLFQKQGGNWAVLNNNNVFSVTANQEYTYETTVTVDTVDNPYLFGIMMGYIDNTASPAGTITVSYASLVEVGSDNTATTVAPTQAPTDAPTQVPTTASQGGTDNSEYANLTYTKMSAAGADDLYYSIVEDGLHANPWYGDGGVTFQLAYSADNKASDTVIKVNGVETTSGVVSLVANALTKLNPKEMADNAYTVVEINSTTGTEKIVFKKGNPTTVVTTTKAPDPTTVAPTQAPTTVAPTQAPTTTKAQTTIDPSVQKPGKVTGLLFAPAGDGSLPYFFAWGASNGASSYNVYINNELVGDTVITNFNAKDYFSKAPAGTYTVAVTAVNAGGESERAEIYLNFADGEIGTYVPTTTQAPTDAPTQAPTTTKTPDGPTDAPTTVAPTQEPTTVAPDVDWAKLQFLGDGAGDGKYSNMFKAYCADSDAEIINIQSKNGIPTIFTRYSVAIDSASLDDAIIEGAGVFLPVDAFTQEETAVTVKDANGKVYTVIVYNAKYAVVETTTVAPTQAPTTVAPTQGPGETTTINPNSDNLLEGIKWNASIGSDWGYVEGTYNIDGGNISFDVTKAGGGWDDAIWSLMAFTDTVNVKSGFKYHYTATLTSSVDKKLAVKISNLDDTSIEYINVNLKAGEPHRIDINFTPAKNTMKIVYALGQPAGENTDIAYNLTITGNSLVEVEAPTTVAPTTTVAPVTTTKAPVVTTTKAPVVTTVKATTAAPATTVAPKVAKVKITKIAKKKKSAKKVKVTIKKLSGVKGYEVCVYKTKKNAKKNVKALAEKSFNASKAKLTIKGKKLAKKKKLFVRARAYTVAGDIYYYGAWSKIKRVKIKK